jgi:hypothetical protein
MSQNTVDFNPEITFLNVYCRWFQGLQSLTPNLWVQADIRILSYIFGGIFLFSFRTILSGFYLMREKGKFIILSGVFLFCTGLYNLWSFDLSLTLGCFTLSCLILVCVLQQRWLNLLGQKKASSHSLSPLEIHIMGKERRAQVRPTCSIIEQLEPHGQSLSSTSGQAELVARKFFKNPRLGGRQLHSKTG